MNEEEKLEDELLEDVEELEEVVEDEPMVENVEEPNVQPIEVNVKPVVKPTPVQVKVKPEIKVVQPKEKKEKKGGNGILTFLLVLLVLILFVCLVGAVGYIYINRDALFGHTTDPDVAEVEEEQDYDMEATKELLTKFKLYGKQDEAWYGYNKTYKEGMVDHIKLSIAIEDIKSGEFEKVYCGNLYKETDQWGRFKTDNGLCIDMTTTISYDKVNEKYNALFDENAPKKGNTYDFYDYLSDKEIYVKTDCGGCGGTTGPHVVVTEIESSKINGNDLVVKVKHNLFILEGKEGNYYFEVGKDKLPYNPEASDYQDQLNNIVETIKSEHMDDVDSYTIKFVKNDNGFTFKSLTKK